MNMENSPSMSIVLRENQTIAVTMSGDVIQKSKKKVLTEEDYTEKMEKIITRDFFPDLPKLKAQNDYLDAVKKGDMAKMHELQMAYRPSLIISRANSIREPFSTPSTFGTPDIIRIDSPSRLTVNNDDTESVAESCAEKKEPCLDDFLNRTTSEDNASFEVIMQKSAVRHQQKYPWLYKDEAAEQQKITNMLTLPSENLAIEDKPTEKLVTWAYTNKNALMYVPDGVELNAKEKLLNENRKKIEHGNTRFITSPFDEEANKEAIAEAASVQVKMKEGKVGIDGKEIIPSDSPEVNGYGFVATPSPAPGVSDTPIMTWGEIEGTPFRLDGSDTPLSQNPSGQQFKIPSLSTREKLALSLADNAAKKHRKQSTSQKAQSKFIGSSPIFGSSSPMTPLEKLQNMSPAAQKLACKKLGIQRETDKVLRASYSPSPQHISSREHTPCAIRTPTGGATPTNKTAKITLSQTETMLNFPKRRKATDFF